MHKKRGRGFGFYVDAAKRGCATPEKIDMLLHGDVLKNPSFKPLENDMPDMKTALSTAIAATKKDLLHATLTAWEKDEQTQLKKEEPVTTFTQPTVPVAGTNRRVFGITNNVTRTTFNYIKDNPGCTPKDVCDALIPQGFKYSSITPIVSQFIKAGTVIKDEHTKALHTTSAEYVALTNKVQRMTVAEALRERLSKPPAKPAKTIKIVKRSQGIAALATPEEPPQLRTPATLTFTRDYEPKKLIERMSVMQAREMYDMLKKIFGG